MEGELKKDSKDESTTTISERLWEDEWHRDSGQCQQAVEAASSSKGDGQQPHEKHGCLIILSTFSLWQILGTYLIHGFRMGSEMFLRVSMDVDGLSVVKANHKHPFFGS